MNDPAQIAAKVVLIARAVQTLPDALVTRYLFKNVIASGLSERQAIAHVVAAVSVETALECRLDNQEAFDRGYKSAEALRAAMAAPAAKAD